MYKSFSVLNGSLSSNESENRYFLETRNGIYITSNLESYKYTNMNVLSYLVSLVQKNFHIIIQVYSYIIITDIPSYYYLSSQNIT